MESDTQITGHRSRRQTFLNELLVIFLYILTLTVLTYPLVFRIAEIIPFHNPDTYTAMWQNWWLKTAITHGLDPHYSTYLFYPAGLDTTLIPQRWSSYPLWAIYSAFLGEPTAYNLTVLTQSIIRAYAMFRFILLFISHRPAAWVGGAFFAFAPRILVGGIQQPNTGSVEFIPIFMIFFVLALRQVHKDPQNIRRFVLLMIIASIAFSANVYMNIKLGVFAMLLGGVYILWRMIADRLWQYKTFWIGVMIFAILSAVINIPIMLPTLSFGGLGEAIDQYVPSQGINLLAFLKADIKYPYFYNYLSAANDGVLLTQRLPSAFAQIGFVSIILGLIGGVVVTLKYPRERLWIVVLFFSFWLSLGTLLIVGKTKYAQIPMLMTGLQYNPLIQALREPFRFQILMNFALTLLIARGIYSISQRLPRPMFRIFLVFTTALMFYEISVFPIPYRTAEISPVYEYVMEHHNGPIISMPMGRQQSKYAMYNQIYHEQPIAEGMIARMPDDAYDTFDSYLLLRDMADIDDILKVRDDLFANWDDEIQRLLDIGFRYVVVHRLEDTGTWLIVTHPYQEHMFFMEIEPDFETETAAVYDLEKLIGNPPTGDPFEVERQDTD